jgi:replication fork clamp-binding protein CrfC
LEIFQYVKFQIKKKYFKHVKAPKYTRQGKCDTCIELKEKRKKAVTEEEKQHFHKLFAEVIF